MIWSPLFKRLNNSLPFSLLSKLVVPDTCSVISTSMFKSLDVRDYGDFDIAPKKPSWPVIILFYAYLMKIFFPFRNLFNSKKNKIYFVCKNKL